MIKKKRNQRATTLLQLKSMKCLIFVLESILIDKATFKATCGTVHIFWDVKCWYSGGFELNWIQGIDHIFTILKVICLSLN